MTKETALAKISEADKAGALVFVDRQNGFPTTELYSTELTSIRNNKDDDCFLISKKFMPKKEIVDRIGEASGIIFTRGETKTSTIEDANCGRRTVYVGIAQGKVRMPDGSWRESSLCDYEFDPTLRAMLDYDVTELNETTKKKQRTDKYGKSYGSTLARAILEYQKVACQRANTGARLRVIRELVGMPIAFTAEEIAQPVVFSRIVQNTSYILQTPEGRAMATAQALGVDVAALFGGKKALPQAEVPQAEAGQKQPEAPDTIQDAEYTRVSQDTSATEPQSETIPDFEDMPPQTAPKQASEFERMTQTLLDFLNGYDDVLNVTIPSNGLNPRKLVETELDNQNATVETRGMMIERTRTYLLKKGCKI